MMEDTEKDPVDQLLDNARNLDASPASFRVTGEMMQFYAICKRELWFRSRDLTIDPENPGIVRGTHVDETSYEDRRRSIPIRRTITVDLLDDGTVVEVKPSSRVTRGARLQLLYYLWFLEEVLGEEREGVLAYPTERKRERVQLGAEERREVEDAIREIYEIVRSPEPPPAERKDVCSSCSYHDFCWCI